MGGGAWPFLVGGLPCQVDSGNERDLGLLTSFGGPWPRRRFLEGLLAFQPAEARGDNRSVMPLDVLGRTRATLMYPTSI